MPGWFPCNKQLVETRDAGEEDVIPNSNTKLYINKISGRYSAFCTDEGQKYKEIRIPKVVIYKFLCSFVSFINNINNCNKTKILKTIF